MRVKPLLPPLLAAVLVGGLALVLGHSRATVPVAAAKLTSGAAVRLTIANYAYAPPSLTVKAGTVVTVRNSDSTAHTVTDRAGSFDSGSLQPGASHRLTLTKAGTYTYFCQFHAFMTGTIKVLG